MKMVGVAMEYPSYGIYEGKPSDSAIFEDSLILYEYLVNCGVDPMKIFLVGRSLGAGPAVYLASKRKVAALVLISPMKSIRQVARNFIGCFSFLIKEQFNSYENIRSVTCPTFFIHGKKDKLIPYQHSKELYDRCKCTKDYSYFLEMTHNEYRVIGQILVPIKAFYDKRGVIKCRSDQRLIDESRIMNEEQPKVSTMESPI